MKKVLVSTLLICALFAAAAARAETTVVFVPKLTESAFFDAANAGAQDYASRHGFKVSYEGNPEADVRHQIAIIDEAIRGKADAICISALDPDALDSALKRAMKSGVKITTWDADVNGDARSLMVSQGTPDQLGRMLVEMGAKSLMERGKNPIKEQIRYAWHYSSPNVRDQNSWQEAGEKYIERSYPRWVNVAPENYYSGQNDAQAVSIGKKLLDEHPDVDLIICNDSTSLPGQATAARERGLSAGDITITGFATPNTMRKYCKDGTIARWGLWDCRTQAAMACFLASSLASGKTVTVGDKISIPEIGTVEVMPNTVLDPAAHNTPDSGVVLMPQRVEFTASNVDEYNF